MMKRLILVLFIIFGTLSFSAFDKVVIGVINDNYENPIISGTINRGGLANLLFGMKKDGDFARQMYQNLSDADKIEFIIEKHDESALISLLKIFEKRKPDLIVLAGFLSILDGEILEKYKIVPDFVPDEYLVDRLAEDVVKYTDENDNILIVTSDIYPCDTDKYNSLQKRNYEKVVAYNTKKLKVDRRKVLETLKNIDVITFLSSSTVEAFYESLDGDFFILGDKKIASIGPMTSETIRRLGMKVDYEAEKYTADGLLDIIFK